jgi:hypothetical protein
LSVKWVVVVGGVSYRYKSQASLSEEEEKKSRTSTVEVLGVPSVVGHLDNTVLLIGKVLPKLRERVGMTGEAASHTNNRKLFLLLRHFVFSLSNE